jgi:CheY-like chemotaxis protein
MPAHSILVVDDDRVTCGILAGCLSVYGYETDVAYDGPAALRLMEQNHYGFTISDYQMPGMNGIDLFKAMRDLNATLPGILLTACVKEELEPTALGVGMREVISKPPDIPQLVAIIEDEFVKANENKQGLPVDIP